MKVLVIRDSDGVEQWKTYSAKIDRRAIIAYMTATGIIRRRYHYEDIKFYDMIDHQR